MCSSDHILYLSSSTRINTAMTVRNNPRDIAARRPNKIAGFYTRKPRVFKHSFFNYSDHSTTAELCPLCTTEIISIFLGITACPSSLPCCENGLFRLVKRLRRVFFLTRARLDSSRFVVRHKLKLGDRFSPHSRDIFL